jgi:hypothetical protein
MLKRTTYEKDAKLLARRVLLLLESLEACFLSNRGCYYDKIPAKPATEPPLPSSDAAQNHVPNPYLNGQLTTRRLSRSATALAADQRANIDYKQEATTYPESFPYFVRGRDSLRNVHYWSASSQIAIYDGAMGTMIQNYAKRNKPRRGEYRERLQGLGHCCEGNNDMLSITQPDIIKGICTRRTLRKADPT